VLRSTGTVSYPHRLGLVNLKNSALKKSFLNLRARQVKDLTAVRPEDRSSARRGSPWPKPSKDVLRRWKALHLEPSPTVTTMTRMLFLLDYQPEERFGIFQRECHSHAIAPSTEVSYWVAFISAQRWLSLAISAGDRQRLKMLKRRGASFIQRTPEPLRHDHFQKLASNTSPAALAIRLAWLTGQRISDMAQLQPRDVVREGFGCTITLRSGKTIVHTGQFSVGIAQCNTVSAVLALSSQRSRQRYLFTDGNFVAFKEEVARVLKSVDPSLELKSIRRGGLGSMAAEHWEDDDVLAFSKHRDKRMLSHYLRNDAANLAKMKRMAQVTKSINPNNL
jgi:integrase